MGVSLCGRLPSGRFRSGVAQGTCGQASRTAGVKPEPETALDPLAHKLEVQDRDHKVTVPKTAEALIAHILTFICPD